MHCSHVNINKDVLSNIKSCAVPELLYQSKGKIKDEF